MSITNEQASANILAHVEAGTLVQGKWHERGNDGREIACLLGSIDPSINNPSDCNADLMPIWLAELTPTLFDGIPNDEIYHFAKRYGTLVGQWHKLTSDHWNEVLHSFLIYTIDQALNRARPLNVGKVYWEQVENACEQCKVAIRNKSDIDTADAAYAADAAADAAYTAYTAAYTAYAAADARSAAYAAYTAADAAAYTADAAYTAADAAADAAYTAYTAAYTADAAYTAAANYQKLFTFLLDQIELKLV